MIQAFGFCCKKGTYKILSAVNILEYILHSCTSAANYFSFAGRKKPTASVLYIVWIFEAFCNDKCGELMMPQNVISGFCIKGCVWNTRRFRVKKSPHLNDVRLPLYLKLMNSIIYVYNTWYNFLNVSFLHQIGKVPSQSADFEPTPMGIEFHSDEMVMAV